MSSSLFDVLQNADGRLIGIEMHPYVNDSHEEQVAVQKALDEGEQALMDQWVSFGRSGDALHFVSGAQNFANLTPPDYGEWYFTLAQG